MVFFSYLDHSTGNWSFSILQMWAETFISLTNVKHIKEIFAWIDRNLVTSFDESYIIIPRNIISGNEIESSICMISKLESIENA